MRNHFYLKSMTQVQNVEESSEFKLKEENNENGEIEDLKPGEFMLSALQVLLLNKRLPNGFKLEAEEVYLKTAADATTVAKPNMTGKKRKNNVRNCEFLILIQYSYEDKPKKKSQKKKLTDITASDISLSGQNAKRSAREKKPNYKDDLGFVEQKSKCKDPKLIEISKKCEKIMTKLKKHQFADAFAHSTTPDIPCLSEIEKKYKNYQYTSFFIFQTEIRKMFKHFFSLGGKFPEIYQKAVELSQYFEEIVEVDEPADTQGYETLSKKVQKIESQLFEKMKQTTNPINNLYMQKQPSRQQVPLNEKPLTIQEKNVLGSNIRNLNKAQMKGIINILADQDSLDQNQKFFEFDIEKLSTKKLRELEKYVKKCLKTNQKSTSGTKNASQKVSYHYYM